MNKKNIDSLNISKFQFIIGILLGFTYAFVFYSFMCLVAEGIRIFTIREESYLWIFSKEERSVFNLFFAFISTILGQSVCFVFWIDKPKQAFRKVKIKRLRIVHEQRFMNWFFLNWFSRMAFLCVLISYDVLNDGYVISLFPIAYEYLFVLIVLVLFLQTWNSIRTSFGQKSLRLMIVSMGIITVVSLGFSRVNLIDYERLNKLVLNDKIENKYNFVTPESNSYKKLEHLSLICRFYFVEDKITKRPVIIRDKKEISFDEISREMSVFCDEKSQNEIPFVTYQLHIHKDIKMKHVTPLVKEFSVYGSRIGFAVAPKGFNNEYNIINNSLTKRYHQYNRELDNEGYKKGLGKFKNKIIIRKSENGSYFVNGVLAQKNIEVIKIIQKEITENPDNYIIMLYLDSNATFSSYINILSLFKIAALELRDTYSLNKYRIKFESLNRIEKREIYRKLPLRVYEIFE